jgi:hypothetical protein
VEFIDSKENDSAMKVLPEHTKIIGPKNVDDYFMYDH